MRAWRQGIERGDLLTAALGVTFTLAAVMLTAREGPRLGAGSLLLIAAFSLTVVGWLLAPHIVVAAAIPLFAVIPTAKVLVTPWIGPVKDIVTLAAGTAILVTIMQRRRGRELPPVDRLLVILTVAVLGLYVVNIGGGLSSGQHNLAWGQGVRLVGEPLILLLAGLLLPSPQRTLPFAVKSLAFTGVSVALFGIYQQHVGPARLVGMGYSYENEVRAINGHLRSFGSLDDPFAYAAFLLLALVAVLFGMRRGALRFSCATLISIGIAFSFVRTAAVIAVALGALMLFRSRRTTLAVLLLGASCAAAFALLFAVAGASQTRAVQAGPGIYLTLNGRTKVWSTIFAKPSNMPFGFGVGKVGTAAQRAQYGLTDHGKVKGGQIAVDSAYFATVADVGFLGFAVFLAFLARLVVLSIGTTKLPGGTRWLALAWLIVILIDAVTRESFTGFPTAFIGMLVVGLALADSAVASRSAARLAG